MLHTLQLFTILSKDWHFAKVDDNDRMFEAVIKSRFIYQETDFSPESGFNALQNFLKDFTSSDSSNPQIEIFNNLDGKFGYDNHYEYVDLFANEGKQLGLNNRVFYPLAFLCEKEGHANGFAHVFVYKSKYTKSNYFVFTFSSPAFKDFLEHKLEILKKEQQIQKSNQSNQPNLTDSESDIESSTLSQSTHLSSLDSAGSSRRSSISSLDDPYDVSKSSMNSLGSSYDSLNSELSAASVNSTNTAENLGETASSKVRRNIFSKIIDYFFARRSRETVSPPAAKKPDHVAEEAFKTRSLVESFSKILASLFRFKPKQQKVYEENITTLASPAPKIEKIRQAGEPYITSKKSSPTGDELQTDLLFRHRQL